MECSIFNLTQSNNAGHDKTFENNTILHIDTSLYEYFTNLNNDTNNERFLLDSSSQVLNSNITSEIYAQGLIEVVDCELLNTLYKSLHYFNSISSYILFTCRDSHLYLLQI